MSDDAAEIDFDRAKPVNEGAKKAKEFFAKDAPSVEDPIHDVGNLEYKELCEELLKEYHAVADRLKALEDIKDMLRANIVKCMGREESAQRGGFAVWIKDQERKGEVDWKRLVQDGEITEAILEQYRKPSSRYKKVEVKPL